MNNGLKPSKVTVNIETMPCFSASIADMRIAPVTRVVMGTPEAAKSGRLEISIVGKCGDIEFLRRADFVKECYFADSYNLKSTSSCVFDFDFDSFEYDIAFLNSLEEEVMADVYALVTFGGMEYMVQSRVLLLPKNTWFGLDGEPSVVASFVNDDEKVSEICSFVIDGDKINYNTSSRNTVMTAVKELYKRLKDCNIIYTRPVGYAANAKQTIRSAGELFGSSSVLATPLEIALVFTSCARKIGFDTSLLFVRNRKGEITVLCGVHLVKSSIGIPVCEDAEKIKAMVEAGDILIIDPSVFAAAQNTSLVLAIENTAESFIENSQSLVCMVEIERAKSMTNENVSDEYASLPVKNAVAQVYSSLVSSPVMQFLSGKKREEIEDIPLLLSDFDGVFKNSQQELRLLPLDFNVDLTDFAAIDKDFSSIITNSSPKATQHFSSNELLRLKERFERLKEKITRDGEITTAFRDETLYRAASSMAFGKNKKEPYFTFGYVKITDKLTELVSFAPICLVRANLRYDSGNFYVSQVGNPVVNKVFIRNALRDSSLGYDSFMKSLMPTDKTEIFDLFENIRMALMETDDRHVYEIVKEAHIVNIDIDDYALWSNLALLRKKISASENTALVFGEKTVEENINKSYVPAIPLFSEGMKAVCNDSSIVVEGAFTEEKEQVITSAAARVVSSGKSMLVVTDDMEMSEYVYRLLSERGMSDMVYVADEYGVAFDAAKKISDNIEKYKDSEDKGVGFVSPELFDVNDTLLDYQARINNKHSMGMSLKEAVMAYLSANSGVSGYSDIHVDKGIFEYADESRLDNIFERVGELITIATNLCKKSGLERHTPIKEHPLYDTNPRDDLDEAAKETLSQAIKNAIPVLSEYRDVFLDVNEILGFNDRDIDSLYKLEKLNDLYKLILTARDIDIPEKFVESDIADFSRNKRFEEENKKRMEAIEFKLNFFRTDIFSELEIILHGDEYDEDSERGFLKKFMTKKNNQDVLLQYVKPEKKSDFQQQKIADIYKLLYEYKSCIVSLKRGAEGAEISEESMRLAKISEKAAFLVSEIAEGSSDSKKLLSNVFRLISVIPIDSSLARKITLVRARLAELYSGENSMVSILTAGLGIDFNNLVFPDGILSFDGLGKYLDEIEKKLEITELWILWKRRSKAAMDFVPGFVKYLEEHGAGRNVDRIFAKSLLSPVASCIKRYSFSDFSDEKLGKAKDKYPELLYKACMVSSNNVLETYKKVAKHMGETNVINADEYGNTELKDLFAKNASLVQKMLPVFVVTKNMLSSLFPFEAKFDVVVTLDNKDNGFTMLPALVYGERFIHVNMSKVTRSSLCERLVKNVPTYDVCKISSSKDPYLFSWLNAYAFDGKYMLADIDEKSCVELVRMNGTFERTTSRTNKTEAELALVKATGLLQDENSVVVITAFTKEQCTYLEKLMYILSKKNKILASALGENRVSICTPDRLYMKKYDSLVVCACFGADKDGRLGWDFGYAGRSSKESVPEAYVSIADRKTEKTYLLTSLNVKDSRFMRRTGNNASVFNSLCELLSDGRIPMRPERTDAEREDSIISNIMSCLEGRKMRAVLCEGKTPLRFALRGVSDSSLYILCDNDANVKLHDELLVMKKLEDEGKMVTTLTPMSLAGNTYSDTIGGFVRETDNI